MTDKQIIDVLIKRAAKAGASLRYTQPNVVLMQKYNKKLYVGMQFKESLAYPLCFFDNNKQVVFRLSSCNEGFSSWSKDIIKKISSISNIIYNPDDMPDFIRHEVSMAIIEALKNPKVGIKLIGFLNIGTLSNMHLVEPEETYEQISIEADMTLFDDEMLTAV